MVTGRQCSDIAMEMGERVFLGGSGSVEVGSSDTKREEKGM